MTEISHWFILTIKAFGIHYQKDKDFWKKTLVENAEL
jgi:hypothetical protein